MATEGASNTPAENTNTTETTAASNAPAADQVEDGQCHVAWLNLAIGDGEYLKDAKLKFELYKDVAPKAVENFERLIRCAEPTEETKDLDDSEKVVDRDRCYFNTELHRVINNYMIKGGDTTCSRIFQGEEAGTGKITEVHPCQPGTGGKSAFGEPFPAEEAALKLHHHTLGTLSMANDGSEQKLQNSQFFINLNSTDNDALDGNYGIFGSLIGGSEVMWMLQSFGSQDDGKIIAPEEEIKKAFKMSKDATWDSDDGPLAPEDGPWPEPIPGPDGTHEGGVQPWPYRAHEPRPADDHRLTFDRIRIVGGHMETETAEDGTTQLKVVPCKILRNLRLDRATLKDAMAKEEAAAKEKFMKEQAAKQAAAAAQGDQQQQQQQQEGAGGEEEKEGAGGEEKPAGAEGEGEGYVYVEEVEADVEGLAGEADPLAAALAEADW
eukprot:tig00021428_g21148.t1